MGSVVPDDFIPTGRITTNEAGGGDGLGNGLCLSSPEKSVKVVKMVHGIRSEPEDVPDAGSPTYLSGYDNRYRATSRQQSGPLS
jgi:hypothetical protein